MKKIFQYLKYGNYTKKDFDDNYFEISFENHMRLKAFTCLLLGFSTVIFLVTFLIPFLKDVRYLYFSLTMISLLAYYLNNLLMQKYTRFLIYLYYIFVMLVFFLLGLINPINSVIASCLICGCYIFVPFILMDKPNRYNFILLLCTVSLLLRSFYFKDFNVFILDAINFTMHTIVSSLLSYYLYNFRMLQIMEKCEITKGRDTDYLTGLKSRRALESFVNDFLKNGKNKSEETVLILLDLDNFKMINDKFGHLTGDKVLKKVAKTLEDTYKKESIISRVGGDEFVIFLSKIANRKEVETLVSETIKKIANISVKNTKLIGCSIGISYPETCKNYKTIFNKADIAMYQAKTNGKNRFETYQC